MKSEKGFLSTKTIIIIILAILLLGITITGTVLFLRDLDKAEDMSKNIVSNLVVEGANDTAFEEQQSTNEQQAAQGEIENINKKENVEESLNQIQPTETISTTNVNTANTIMPIENENRAIEPLVSTVERERVISEETILSWNDIELNEGLAATNLFINYQNLKYKVEYYFDGVIDEKLTEEFSKNKKGEHCKYCDYQSICRKNSLV